MTNLEFFQDRMYSKNQRHNEKLSTILPEHTWMIVTAPTRNLKPEDYKIPGQVRGYHKQYLDAEFIEQAPPIISKKGSSGWGIGVKLADGSFLWLHTNIPYKHLTTTKSLVAPHGFKFI